MTVLAEPGREVVPPERIPGLPALAVGLATGRPDVSRFLPDRPALPAVVARAAAVSARFAAHPRPGADPAHAALAAGGAAAVSTGQQVGALTGPLLTLVKAVAAIRLAQDVDAAGCRALPLFWCASEDHDLVEVSRLPLPAPDGLLDAGPDAEPLRGNRLPVGELPVGVDLDAALRVLAAGSGEPAFAQDVEAFLSIWRGRRYREAFVDGVRWLLRDDAPLFADAARRGDKPSLVPLAARVVRERAEVRRLLTERAAALTGAGFPLQVTSEPGALPLFAIVDGERLLLREEGSRLVLKGGSPGRSFSDGEVVERFESGEWLPSFAALARPLAASTLFPVAATILGPAEIAYWAQAYPLFDWAGVLPPVIVPRPMAAVVDPTSASLLSRAGLSIEGLLAGREELLRRHGGGRAAEVLARLSALRDSNAAELASVRDALLSVDPTLGRPLDATAQNLAFAIGKLTEKAAAAAGRADETFARQADRLLAALLPDGRLAERVLSPLPFLARHGRDALVSALLSQLRWDVAGLQEIRP